MACSGTSSRKNNEPSFVEYVAKEIAAIRNVDVQEIEKVSTENARRLFQGDFVSPS